MGINMNYNLIAKRLKELRNEKKISQETLSEQLENMECITISARQIQNIENTSQIQDEFSSKKHAVFGLRTETLYALAKYYGVSVDYILGLSDSKRVDVNAKAAHIYTGLDEKTIAIIHELNIATRINSRIIDYIFQKKELITSLLEYFKIPFLKIYKNSDYDRFACIVKHKPISATYEEKIKKYAMLLDSLPCASEDLEKDINEKAKDISYKTIIAIEVAKEYTDIISSLKRAKNNSEKDLIYEISHQKPDLAKYHFNSADRIECVQNISQKYLKDLSTKKRLPPRI